MKQTSAIKKGTSTVFKAPVASHNGPAEISGRIPPQAVELEVSVLGTILNETNALSAVVDFLRPEHFYLSQHEAIYEAILLLFVNSQPVDSRTVVNELRKAGKLEFAGGTLAIAQLASQAASAAQIEYHGRVIVERAMKRDLISIASEIHHSSYEDTVNPTDLLDLAERKIFGISRNNVKREIQSVKSVMQLALNLLNSSIQQTSSSLRGVPSGFSELDRLTSGWQKSDLVILAARPGVGKTAFVISILRNAAVDHKRPVALFSLEMASSQITNRFIASEAEISSEMLRRGEMSAADWQRIINVAGILSEAPIFIDDTAAISILELRSKARRLKSEHKIELIVVDYLQLMTGDTSGNREQEIASISRALKGLAKELDIPIIALSQLSRGVETRGGDKRPQLSDLRESGSIEQDADLVLFLYRPEYYGITIDEEGLPTNGLAEVIIAKHRNGDTGKIRLLFRSMFTKFLDYFHASPLAVPDPLFLPASDCFNSSNTTSTTDVENNS